MLLYHPTGSHLISSPTSTQSIPWWL
uniref:Uncharacterized protein n=1 Tax=Rhizophora mucronata TaxID=61149 RepID=A0A2P2Q5N5_RHIMU